MNGYQEAGNHRSKSTGENLNPKEVQTYQPHTSNEKYGIAKLNNQMWDFQATQLTIYFNELPLDEDITIVLTDWYNDLKDEPAGRQPVKVKGYFKHQTQTTEGRLVPANQSVVFVFWHGIYDKWLNAPKINLNVLNRLELTLMKTGAKKWRILKLEGN